MKTANKVSELARNIDYEIAVSLISADDAAAKIISMIESMERMNGEHSKAIARIARDAMAAANRYHKENKNDIMFASELKTLVAWLGMVKLGWV